MLHVGVAEGCGRFRCFRVGGAIRIATVSDDKCALVLGQLRGKFILDRVIVQSARYMPCFVGSGTVDVDHSDVLSGNLLFEFIKLDIRKTGGNRTCSGEDEQTECAY